MGKSDHIRLDTRSTGGFMALGGVPETYLECLGCGDRLVFDTPITTTELYGKVVHFKRAHRVCADRVEETAPADNESPVDWFMQGMNTEANRLMNPPLSRHDLINAITARGSVPVEIVSKAVNQIWYRFDHPYIVALVIHSDFPDLSKATTIEPIDRDTSNTLFVTLDKPVFTASVAEGGFDAYREVMVKGIGDKSPLKVRSKEKTGLRTRYNRTPGSGGLIREYETGWVFDHPGFADRVIVSDKPDLAEASLIREYYRDFIHNAFVVVTEPEGEKEVRTFWGEGHTATARKLAQQTEPATIMLRRDTGQYWWQFAHHSGDPDLVTMSNHPDPLKSMRFEDYHRSKVGVLFDVYEPTEGAVDASFDATPYPPLDQEQDSGTE